MFEENQSDTIQAVVAAQDILDCVSELNRMVNDETLGVEIDALGIYCQKTGAKIGGRDQNSLFSLHKLCGKDAIVGNLYNATALCTHPVWLITNGEALDDLMSADPINYACYCFGLFTAEYYQTARNKDQRKQPYADRYWAMARANALMNARGVGGIDELNIELQRALIYAPDTLKYISRKIRAFSETPDNLAQLAVSGDLLSIVKDATDKVTSSIGMANIHIERTRFVDIALSAADAARGPSNIRMQKRTKRDVAETQMMKELRDLMGNIHFTETKVPDYAKIRARMQKADDELENELLSLSIETNFDIEMDDIEIPGYDPNSVEINTLSTNVADDGMNPNPIPSTNSENTNVPDNLPDAIMPDGTFVDYKINQSMAEIGTAIHKAIASGTPIEEAVKAIPSDKLLTMRERLAAKLQGGGK